MCRLDVTLAQSSNIAPDSSPRRVHLDAAVRGRLLRRAHLESLQHPASTSRGKHIHGARFPSIALASIRISSRSSHPSSLLAPVRNFSPRLIPTPFDPASSRTGGGLRRTCKSHARLVDHAGSPTSAFLQIDAESSPLLSFDG